MRRLVVSFLDMIEQQGALMEQNSMYFTCERFEDDFMHGFQLTTVCEGLSQLCPKSKQSDVLG